MNEITRPGVLVRGRDGKLGITTSERRVRTPQIGVQFVGMPYPVMCQIDELVPVQEPVA